jgi:SAM-dependent methyltransferase
MPVDVPTSRFYAQAAAEYAAIRPHGKFVNYRDRFMSLLPSRGCILDLGCRGGHDSRVFLDAGFKLTAIDASVEMAALASARIDQNVIVRAFQDLDCTDEFDGVWASASLLHVQTAEIPDIFQRIRCGLRPGGLLCASFKEAESDWRDMYGRIFCAMTASLLCEYLTAAAFNVDAIERYEGYGSDALPTTWIWAFASLPR